MSAQQVRDHRGRSTVRRVVRVFVYGVLIVVASATLAWLLLPWQRYERRYEAPMPWL